MTLVVRPTNNGQILVNTILGEDITVLNVTYNSVTISSGTLTNSNALGIGINEGIILISSDATLAPAPNDQVELTLWDSVAETSNLGLRERLH